MEHHPHFSSQRDQLKSAHIFRLGYSEMGAKEKICVVCDESFRTEDGQLKAHQVRIKTHDRIFKRDESE